MKTVTKETIRAGLETLDLTSRKVVVHSSLSSFAKVEGGPNAVIKALTSLYSTVLMPAFSWEANAPPPADDRPERNGCHYSFYDNWNRPPVRFKVESAGIEKSMGVISRCFLSWPGVLRSDHPWHSWAAWGKGAKHFISPHPFDTTNIPLERFSEDGGWVLLMGVGLTSCTAIHVAEEKAGRRPFIRWMRDRVGVVRRVRVSGCAKGFDRLFPYCLSMFREVRIGSARVLAAPLNQLITSTVETIKANPEITRCSPQCIRCADAILGGPEERI